MRSERPIVNQLVIFAKNPRAGTVKTRLGRDIGMDAAAWWYRHQIQNLVRGLQSPRWTMHLCISPDTALRTPALPSTAHRFPQGRGDLGDRMRRAFQTAPKGPMVLIGSDIPGIRSHHIAKAFEELKRKDIVFGPAPDGGYWLVGMRRNARPISRTSFSNVRWSSEFALSDTVRSLGDATIGYIDHLQDIDTVEDLKRYRQIVGK